MPRPEEIIHIALCDYMKMVYPKVLFLSESSGIRTSIGVAKKLKRTRSNHTHLDLYILEPKRIEDGIHCGLVLEIKAKNIFKKDGTLLKNEHHEEQQKTIDLLNSKGYLARFVCSFDEGKKLIDKYLK